jgi:short-subunit dehydrogenase
MITGASRGIGEAIAHAFRAADATVALVARSENALQDLAVRLGGTAHATDLSDPSQVAGLIDRVEAEAGPVDILVNNAGIDSNVGFTDVSETHLRTVTQVNYLAPAELCRQIIPRMLSRGGGHIVNVSSMGGSIAFPGNAPYSASKAALSQLTAGLRADLRGLPIHTTLVALGPVPTDMLAESEDFPPTAQSYRRLYRMGLMVDVSREKVAREVVAAVDRKRRYVFLPRRCADVPLVPEIPRFALELLLTGVPHQAKRPATVSDQVHNGGPVVRAAPPDVAM